MDKITKSEYRMLDACAKKPCEFHDIQVSNLLDNNYLTIDFDNKSSKEGYCFYQITHDGQLAYEHYHNYIFERRLVSLRAWLALALSLASIVLTIYNMFFMPA